MAKALVAKDTGVVHDIERPWLGGNLEGGDPRGIDVGVFNYLIERFDPGRLVDVGCGEGELMSYFHDTGIDVIGVEGLEDNKDNANDDIKEQIIIHDYTKGVLAPTETDMTISCEFVEHVHKIFMVNFLPQFLSCNVLVFTHAIENQQGHHHVNCENDPYWISLITSLGMIYLEKETMEVREQIAIDSFWDRVLIFKKKFT